MNIDEVRLLYVKGDVPPEKYIGFFELEKRKYKVKAETGEALPILIETAR
ncbi:MAG: hypothetical protein LBR10_00675 [Prevotellaceae bacterium]|jgi:hypothetical protein|nr:hypothetical protein [Prevotellaceae bacterium]